jgi:hypothetical protein
MGLAAFVVAVSSGAAERKRDAHQRATFMREHPCPATGKRGARVLATL